MHKIYFAIFSEKTRPFLASFKCEIFPTGIVQPLKQGRLLSTRHGTLKCPEPTILLGANENVLMFLLKYTLKKVNF